MRRVPFGSALSFIFSTGRRASSWAKSEPGKLWGSRSREKHAFEVWNCNTVALNTGFGDRWLRMVGSGRSILEGGRGPARAPSATAQFDRRKHTLISLSGIRLQSEASREQPTRLRCGVANNGICDGSKVNQSNSCVAPECQAHGTFLDPLRYRYSMKSESPCARSRPPSHRSARAPGR